MLRREERHLRWAVGRGNRHLRWAVGSLGQGQEGRPCDIFEGAGLEKWEGGLAYGSENRPLQIQILKADVLSLTGHPCVPVADVSGAHPLSPPPPTDKAWERAMAGGLFEARLVPAGHWRNTQLGEVGLRPGTALQWASLELSPLNWAGACPGVGPLLSPAARRTKPALGFHPAGCGVCRGAWSRWGCEILD